MSNRLINLAYKTSHKGITKGVIVYLADQVREKHGDICYPAVETIARNVGASPRTVRYSLRVLEAAGDITRHFRSGTSSYYQVHPGSGCTPAKSAGVQNTTQTPAKNVRHPCRIRRETSMNQEKNRGAVPIGTVASRIVARQVEREDTGDDSGPVDPAVFGAFRRAFGEQT